MSFLLDGVLPEYPSWRNYFDAVVTGRREAGLLLRAAAALALGPAGERLGEAQRRWSAAGSYEGGDLPTLERLIGIGGDRVLYVGDHIYGDILRSKKSSLWRTCMVVQELERELAWLEQQPADPADRAVAAGGAAGADGGRAGGPPCRPERPRPAARADVPTLAGRDGAGGRARRRQKGELEALRRALRTPTPASHALERSVENGPQPVLGPHLQGRERELPLRRAGRGLRLPVHQPGLELRLLLADAVLPLAARRRCRTSAPPRPAYRPWGDAHAAPLGGDRPSKASRASR